MWLACSPSEQGSLAWKYAISAHPACASRRSVSAATTSVAASISRRTRKVIHKALDLGITLFDTADTYGERGGSETCMGQVLGDDRKRIVLATKFGMPMDDDGREGRRLAALHHERGRGQPAPPAHRLDRPVSDPPARSAHADRGNAARARRPGPPGQGALHRLLQLPGLAGDRGAVDREDLRAELRSFPARTNIRWCSASPRPN